MTTSPQDPATGDSSAETAEQLSLRVPDEPAKDLPEQRAFDFGHAQSAAQLLRRIQTESRTQAEKGRWFENLFLRVARNEPDLEIEAIHRWGDWPEREELTGLSGQDIGVDLVAKHHDGTWIAIQCKCYEREHRITKDDVQRFVTGSQHETFALRWIVATSRWGRTAEAIIKGSNIRRIDFLDYQDRLVEETVERPIQEPWPLQDEAIADVVEGLQHHDRGRMIMACGTGKTFTALRIAERTVSDGDAILFLAPSIALVSQARREWLRQTTRPLTCIVVCSDPYAGGRNEAEDISLSELACPVTSKPEEIAAKLRYARHTKAVFCTYQSLMQVSAAQKEHGAPAFALTIADEAHRTTGALKAGNAKVNFQAVHDDEILRTAKRLYMTATPRIYTERSKGQLAKKQIEVVDMNDQEVYGPQLHRLRFKTAVEAGMLSDYRVILLGVNQSQVTPGLRQRLEDIEHAGLSGKKKPGIGEMTRVLGLSLAINGITRGTGLERPERLVRTMAYSNTIARSKWFAAALAESQVKAATTKRLDEGRARPIEVIHLDASASALQRNQELRRLAQAEEDRALRIICNVKLFTEGVDVPNLNAVAFMDPRDSQVDVVQAVGRVMRKAPDKTLGYIVIPVIVEPDQNIADALEKSQEGYQTVGRVLRALQAHDERLLEDIARFVEVYEPSVKPPADRRDRDDDLQDVLDLEPAGQEIYAHVAAASGLGRPGLLVAEQIEWAVRSAATVFQSTNIENDLAGILGLAVDDEGGAKGICTIAALLLCNACLMHRRLKDLPDKRMLPGLGNVSGTNDPTSVLKAAWATILEQDYAPVFEPALAVVNTLPDAKPIGSAVRQLAECANNVADSLSELGYDHAGPLYHRILGSAKSDGAFYTNNVSALMLARLALHEDFVNWDDQDAVANLRIIDPACGTGTLLMAALRTIKDRMQARRELAAEESELMHRILVEDVLCGLDINRHGVQLAACNLTLGAPTVDYKRMNLHTMKHGPQEDGTVRAGSLEILHSADNEHDLNRMVAPLRGLDTLGSEQVAGGVGAEFELNDVDLVIMNAPFTDNMKRSTKFTADVIKQMQEREAAIREHLMLRDAVAGRSITPKSIRTFFTPLADRISKGNHGTLAKIVPTTACIGSSGQEERQFLANRFHVEQIITTHDPKRINFSENTSIHESLLICRRADDRQNAATEFISLHRMPRTAAEVIEAVEAITQGNEAWGKRLLWPAERVRQGDWTPVQWYNGDLAEATYQLEQSDRLVPLALHHRIGAKGGAAQHSWKRCTLDEACRDSRAVRIFGTISSKLRRTMAGEPEQWVIPGGGQRVHLWENVKKQGSHLLVAERFNTITGRLTALHTEEKTFGFGWRPIATSGEEESKALCLWLNSTPARLQLLNRRAKTLTYPNWSTEHWASIRVPKDERGAMRLLANAWEELKDEELLEMRFADSDPVRTAIDAAAARASSFSESTIATWREKLSHEPTVTNQRAA